MTVTQNPDAFEAARRSFIDGLDLLQAGAFPEAEASFEASLALVPGRISTLINLAAVQVLQGRHAQALKSVEQVLAVEPDNADAWLHGATALARLGRHDEALVAFDKRVSLDGAQVPAEAWFRRGQTLQALGLPDAALGSYDRALEADPTLMQAWTNRGTILREAGHGTAAAEAFRKAIELGADPELHRYYLAAAEPAEVRETPRHAPSHYVETLFDDYASEYDTHMVEQLGYNGHKTLTRPLASMAPAEGFGHALDLGCGTGLCGPLLKTVAKQLDGVDLSPRMLDEAGALGVYDRLVQADIVEHLKVTDARYDLVAAADVFIYLGDLAPVFAALESRMRPRGIFCFSVECASDEARDFELRPSLRYAHSQRYLQALAARHGFEFFRTLHEPIREDQSRPIDGLFVYLRRI